MEPPTTLENHCEYKRRLTDKPDTVLVSLNFEQNQGAANFCFFLCTGGPLLYTGGTHAKISDRLILPKQESGK